MRRKTKAKPYIDYKTASVLARMRDFIIHENEAHRVLHAELERMADNIRWLQKKFAPRAIPNDWADALERDRIPNAIANIRHDAWEAGLTDTLFDKLGDRAFRDRFVGWMGEPVLEDEIVERYFEDEESA